MVRGILWYLTDVPCKTRRQGVVDALVLFLRECGEEEEIARLEESVRISHSAHEYDAGDNGLLRLQNLVLEMSDTPEPYEDLKDPREKDANGHPKRHSFTKSSTEDSDSECFMAATECDFTFFGEDDGGLLVSRGRIDAPIRVDDGMIFRENEVLREEIGPLIDVVGLLAGWRRERRACFEAAARFGKCAIDTTLLGHWRGEVKVVR